MAVGKEIRVKIASVQNTQKITRAMEMVATSKMRKAQERMRAARPYADRMRNVISHVAGANSEYRHPFLVARPVKRVGIIVVSTDRGLCGGLNSNLFRMLIQHSRFAQLAERRCNSFSVLAARSADRPARLATRPILSNCSGP